MYVGCDIGGLGFYLCLGVALHGAENKLSRVTGGDHCSPAPVLFPPLPHWSPSGIPNILTTSLMPSGMPGV